MNFRIYRPEIFLGNLKKENYFTCYDASKSVVFEVIDKIFDYK
jgi:hypothetical protein